MAYLDYDGLAHYDELIKDEIGGKVAIGGKAGGIPYSSVDSTSTSTVFTATVDGLTTLYDGACVMLHNGVVTSASGFTINVNGLGAKKCYNNMTNATRETTVFSANYTMLFVYSTELDEGNGGWWLYRGFNSNDNTIGYQLRTNSGNKVASDTGYRYRIWLTQADGKKWVPINTSSSTNATSNRTLNTRPIDPFGPIVYRASNGTCSAGVGLGATSIWQQYVCNIGYSYMASGFSLVAEEPVYLRCTPQSDGSAVMQDITQDLPSSKDGKIYILLGTASNTTNVELSIEHPVYWYDGAGIRLWMGAEPSGASGFSPTVSVEDITGGHEITITDAMGAHSFDIMDGMTILEYGVSTWADFLAAYEANKLVYCRTPTTYGSHMAFLAYRATSGSNIGAEFQYYRSMNEHTATQQGDEVYIYTLKPNSTWTTTVRQAYTKIAAGTGLQSTYSANTGTLTLNSTMPTVTSSDNGKILTVVNGAWTASELPVYDGTVV